MGDPRNPVPEYLLVRIKTAREAVVFFEHRIRHLEIQLREAKVAREHHKQRLNKMLKRTNPTTKKATT